MEHQLLISSVARELKYSLLSENTITEILLAAAQSTEIIQPELVALAGRIALCNHHSNIYGIPEAYLNSNNTTSPATGRFWRCNSKLCPSCLARQSRITRSKLRVALAAQQKKTNERYYFATFTIPNPDLSLLETRSIVNYAWSLFRKRSLCVALIRGGAKSEEFTVTKKGFHYHLHCIFLSKWLRYQTIREVWTDCVRTSFAKHERKFEVKMSDGFLNVNIKCIFPNERSIHEVCKYVTKCDSWSKVARRDLIEVTLIRRWCRMFELFGSFAPRESNEQSESPPIVHTRSLTDGVSPTPSNYWRDLVHRMSVDIYLHNLETEIDRVRDFGLTELRSRFPDRTIILASNI